MDIQLFPFQKNVPLVPAATRALEHHTYILNVHGKKEVKDSEKCE